MDRLFVLEDNYVYDKHSADGWNIQFAMQELCKRHGDDFIRIRKLVSEYWLLFEKNYPGMRVIPIGSLEFVRMFLEKEFGAGGRMKPLEIPACLREYLERPYAIKKGSELSEFDMDPDVSFVKDIDHLKSFTSLFCSCPEQVKERIVPDTTYSVSEHVGFSSEWRVFVCKDQIQGLECYQGDVSVLPDQERMHAMVKTYAGLDEHPGAYTLDLGVRSVERWVAANPQKIHRIQTRQITEPIEVHPFVSVGLYGFYDFRLLDMWDYGYQWYRECCRTEREGSGNGRI